MMSEPADSQLRGPSQAMVRTDWNKCILCQKVTSEILRCSADSKRRDVGTGKGYSTFTSNIVWFSELDELPMPIDLRRLDEGNGIEATLIEHKAKWQKSCHSKFNATKLVLAEKNKSSIDGSDVDDTPRKCIWKRGSPAEKSNTCFFCETSSASEPLYEASTFHLDTRVRKCALVL